MGNDVGLPLRRFRDRCAQRPGRDDGHKMVRRVADLAEKMGGRPLPGLRSLRDNPGLDDAGRNSPAVVLEGPPGILYC